MPRTLLTVDESELGLSWVLDEPMQRACHAILAGGKVWFVDPIEVDEIVDRGAALGAPAGVLQLLDRHNRDCAAVAERLGIEHLRVPDEVPGSPFEAIPAVRLPGWKETALWWPATESLVVAEIVGTNSVFNAGSGGVGMHPMLRAWPPKSIRGYEPAHLFVGHGAPVHGADAAAGLERAYGRSRRDIPKALINLPGASR
ncbi:MAG: hypothetical protein QOI10_664 [Solirubrobacterales bacterium]|jgi:hypothetical protein|nr:hypothetical protein [Solirubrobacterales bacterium]